MAPLYRYAEQKRHSRPGGHQDRIPAAWCRVDRAVADRRTHTNRIARRVESGRFHPAHRGVYAIGHTAFSYAKQWMAAVLACGEKDDANDSEMILRYWGAALSYRSAAALWQLLPPADVPVDISIPGGAGRKRRREIRVHRCPTLLPASVTSPNAIPVTTPARTIADLRGVVAKKGRDGTITSKELRRAIRQAEVLGLPTGAESITEHSRSDLELAFLCLCRSASLSRARGRRLDQSRSSPISSGGRRDSSWKPTATDTTVVESPSKATAIRDLRLRMLGYNVIRLSEQQLDDEADRVADVLRTALRCGGLLSLFGAFSVWRCESVRRRARDRRCLLSRLRGL